MPNLIISDISEDFSQFKSELEKYLAKKDSWKGNLTTMTGQTLLEFVAAIGTFNQTKISRAFADAFTETAVSDEAIRACTIMQGIRMTRKLPARLNVTLKASVGISIPAYSQFECSGHQFFNREVIEFKSSSVNCTLYQGEVHSFNLSGNGESLQTWCSDETDFVVSDTDVIVSLNGEMIPVTYTGLWNFKNQEACQDLTMSDGRLLIQFGSSNITGKDIEKETEGNNIISRLSYGTVPNVNDELVIVYCTTDGKSGNNYVTIDNEVSIDGFSDVSGTALENPKYGADERSTLTYKNNTASSFGTYGSAVTKAQYQAIVNSYPGIVDCVTRSQRELNPGDLKFMNLIWVTGVTESPWDDDKKKEFCEWCENQSMYSCKFVWVDATRIDRKVNIKCFCYSSAVLTDVQENVKAAITRLFAARPGILMTNIYRSDIINTALTADSNISYVTLEEPVTDFIVTQQNAPSLTFTTKSSGGNLTEGQYSYCVTTVNAEGIESLKNNWVHPLFDKGVKTGSVTLKWFNDPNAVKFNIYGRNPLGMGLIKSVSKGTTTFTDNGSIVPDSTAFETGKSAEMRYNAFSSLSDLTVTCSYAERQQRLSETL